MGGQSSAGAPAPGPGGEPDRRRRRGIYLLPNLFTTASLFAGFYAMVMAMSGRFIEAAIAIFVAGVLDGADGRIARMTNTQSAFGAEYDSLADMVAFGVAPALIAYQWALSGLGKIGWLAAFFYAAATALRLARFNTQLGTADKRYFQGLPCPSAAALVAGLVWVVSDFGIAGHEVTVLALPVTVLAGALMVSNIRFYSFKDLDLGDRVPFVTVLVVVLVLMLISSNPPLVLFGAALVYAVSRPLMTLIEVRRRRAAKRAALAAGAARRARPE